MSAKHTPGPWRVTSCLDYWVQSGDIGVALCGDVQWEGAPGLVQDQREMEANARLIAAAPDMLEALKAIRKEIGVAEAYARPAFDAAWRAIAKATGDEP